MGLHRTPVTQEVSAGHCFLDTPPQTLLLAGTAAGHLWRGAETDDAAKAGGKKKWKKKKAAEKDKWAQTFGTERLPNSAAR